MATTHPGAQHSKGTPGRRLISRIPALLPLVPKLLRQRIGVTELRRRLWHISPGLLPFALWPISHADPISPTLQWIMVALIGVLALHILVRYQRIARVGRPDHRTGPVIGYAGSVLAALILLPGQAEIGLTVLAILAFGDGFATLGGMLLRGPKLPWNPAKSWSGMQCFMWVGGLMGAVIYWGESHNLEALAPGVSWAQALACGMSAALIAAIAESIPTQIDDNLRVGVSALATLIVLHTYVFGWA